ncbi:MAG: class I SAM-dependent methyltransferase [Lentisphaerota bacterium]
MTQNRFGYEWTQYSQILPLYEQQFKVWTVPMQAGDWAGLSVLDAGCGTGRNSYWPLQYGAKKVTAFDVDPRTVAVAKQNLARFPNADVQQHSIYETPWTDAFDFAFSIGVIHHLADPAKAVANLVRATKPGGRILIWVYGKEGHTLLKGLVNGIRRVTCRMPLAVLKALVYPFSFLWWAYMRFLPHSHPYMKQFKTAALWHVHSILFDQLLPEIANYWTREEAMDLFKGLPVEKVEAVWVNEGSWTVWATRK